MNTSKHDPTPLSTDESPRIPRDLDEAAFNKDEYFAAAYIGASVETVRSWRKVPPEEYDGPPFRRIHGNMIKFSVATLREWVDSQPLVGGRRID
jgi:hypothetical protein